MRCLNDVYGPFSFLTGRMDICSVLISSLLTLVDRGNMHCLFVFQEQHVSNYRVDVINASEIVSESSILEVYTPLGKFPLKYSLFTHKNLELSIHHTFRVSDEQKTINFLFMSPKIYQYSFSSYLLYLEISFVVFFPCIRQVNSLIETSS